MSMSDAKPTVPEGWELASAAELCEKIQDGTHFSPKAQFAEGVFPYVTAKNVRSSGLDLSKLTYLREEDHRKIYERCDCRRGDVLLVKDGVNTGDVAVNTLDGEISLLSSVCMLRPRASLLSSDYLRYYLQGPQGNRSLTGRMTGTAIRRIILGRIKQTPIVFCSLAGQDRIVEAIDSHLSCLDSAVASLENVQAKLKSYRASVLKAAVEGRLVPTEASLARAEKRDYEPAEVLLNRILKDRRRRWEEAELAKLEAAGRTPRDDKWKAKYEEPVAPDRSRLPELPEGWCWATVDMLGNVKGGLTKGQKRRPKQVLRDVPYLRVANVQRGYLDLSEVKTIRATPDEIAELRLESGDVLFNEGGDRDKLGRGWIWGGEIETCIHQNHVFRVRIFTEDLQPRLLSWYGNSSGQRYFFDEGKQTTNLASVNMTKLKLLPVPIPPKREQTRIGDEVERMLSVADKAAVAVTHDIKRCVRLRQSVLKWAFEGKLADQDPTDEPAETLLARIRAERAAVDPIKKTVARKAQRAA
jgi:type I restriction enzyme S subunit